jgi:hypothetical protein
MKKAATILTIVAIIASLGAAVDVMTVTNNQIAYAISDGQVVKFASTYQGNANSGSNTVSQGQGINQQNSASHS